MQEYPMENSSNSYPKIGLRQYLKLCTLDIFDRFYKLGTERIIQSTEIHQIRYENYSEEVV